MRAIVFGGTGFFGKELVEILLGEGHQVTVVTRGNKSLPERENLELLVADRNEREDLEKVLQDRTWDVAYDQLGFSSNDAKILCDLLEDKIQHLIFTSSKSVYDYGEDLKEEIVDPFSYDLKMGNKEDFEYGEGKRQAESYYIQKAPFSVGIFRPPLAIGKGDTSDRWNWHYNRIKNGEEIYFPNLEAHFCVISSHDAGRTLYKMGVDKVEGPLNFNTANPTLREIVSFMEKGSGKTLITSETEKNGNHSPYGVTDHWSLSRKKAESLGFESHTDFTSLAKELSQG